MIAPAALGRVGAAGEARRRPLWPALTRLWAMAVALGGWRRWLVAALLGAVATLALPPLHLVPALVPAFVGLLWLLQGTTSTAARAGTGFAFGLGYFTAGLYWVANALLTRPEQFGWLAPLAPIGLALILAPFVILPALATRLAPAGGIAQVVVFCAAWTLSEWLRGFVLTGFPWNLVGTVWTFAPPMLQLAAVLGVYGLSLVTVAAATMPSVLAGPSVPPRSAWLAVLATLVILAACAAFGALRLTAAGETKMVEGVRLRLVQPNIAQTIKWRRDLIDVHLADQAALGAQAAEPAPTHVFWSEAAAPLFLTEDAARLARIAAATPAAGLSVVGTLRRTPADQPFQIWNSLVAIDDTAAVVAHYDKAHLVPFGEYMPLRRWLGIGNFTMGMVDFTAGLGVQTLDLPGLPAFSPLICYEAIFPGQVVDRSKRPAWLLNITNDGWYGISAGPYQHLAAARLRTVEEGLPLVRVANTGISAIIDGYGRIVAELALGSRGVLDGPLPMPAHDRTPYSRYGNGAVVALAVLAVLAALAGRWRFPRLGHFTPR